MSNWEEETKVPLVTSCKQAARLVSISFERKLTLREKLTMSLHLLMCKTCALYRKQITALRGIFVRHQDVLENVPPEGNECLDPVTRQRIKDSLSKKK